MTSLAHHQTFHYPNLMNTKNTLLPNLLLALVLKLRCDRWACVI